MAPGGKSLLFGMGEGGIKRLDVELRGKVPRFLEITGKLRVRFNKSQGGSDLLHRNTLSFACVPPSGL